MRNNFDKQLATLNNELTNMGKLCEIAIEKATKALSDGNMVLAREVIQADAEIDQAEKDIERLCLKLLLQQQPVASDLRLVSAALKMITDMERIGDQASDIAEIIISGKICDSVDFPKIMEESSQAVKMVTDSVDAYVNKDLELAGKVEADDDIVDLMFDSVKLQITDMIRTNKIEANRAVDLLMVSKYLERIADHATNIAEWVVFSITGVHNPGVDTKKV
ncbi:MAG: phosphate signaling complex protein PhoU [Lachnospiraceae bacterium]|jgi:phosphate transport system protein|nr:phosphate signaling complex protein PhoU [Lachnospiraceae bacterium]MDD5848234.1 phosphate signaling complex protein PhoU [Bacillota bacterium]